MNKINCDLKIVYNIYIKLINKLSYIIFCINILYDHQIMGYNGGDINYLWYSDWRKLFYH